ncbi:MAG TPA: SMI1/KNR4 family protein [Ramlibacter sp.]|nr:SMI1/KNR4 family protein [Ramlibacter sp.]
MPQLEQALDLAWQQIDERLALIQRRHHDRGDIPLYEAQAGPPATDADIELLSRCLAMPVPLELEHALRKWNGRWIVHDHMISLMAVWEHEQVARASQWSHEHSDVRFESVIGPINPVLESRRRICIGGHEGSGKFLFLDFEDPPAGGHLGQVIRMGEEPTAEFVAPSFLEFLRMVSRAPAYDDDPEFDPLKFDPGKP